MPAQSTQPPDQSKADTAPPNAQLQPAASGEAASEDQAELPGAGDVISYLNQTMNWHHRLAADQEQASDPVDVIYLDDDRQVADQILRLSFEFARAEAQLVEEEHPEAQQQAQPQSQYQALTSAAAEADNEVKERQAQLADLKRKLVTARGRARTDLQSQADAMQSEVELEQTRSQTLHSILQFVGGKDAAARSGNLGAQVEELRRSVPELQSDATKSGQTTAAAATGAAAAQATNRRVQPSGIVNLVSDLLALNRKSRTLQQTRRATDALAKSEEALRAPLEDKLTALAKQSDTVLEQGGEASAGARGSMDELAAQFKQISAAVLPLEKQAILFDTYRNNLDRWRSAVRDQESEDVRALAVRAIILAIIVGFVLVLAEIWRKAIFRYVHDARRRYQFLLLRRVLLWIAIAIAVAFGLASEIGSLATFVGLITAGIAVALQSVIMAIAGYFFLIGRYGVRVGDRVQIAGVTGDVLDIGLVRTHLMEVTSTGAGQQPTGRVVVLSNATVFQPGASLFKQIPGTNYVWHEVTLTLAPESDYGEVEKRMLGAVEAVYAKYRERLEAQHRSMEERLNVSVAALRPQSRLRLTQAGLEIIIRYPVEVEHAAEVDDDVARELLKAIQKTPRLKLVPGGTPNIQRVPEPEAKAG